MSVRTGLSIAVLLTSCLVAEGARADGSDAAAAAETLFREAKSLMAAKDWGAACPKLAESMRLDPGTGTLLTLALCHESAGMTASAWAEFTEAVPRARSEGRQDRIQIATGHAALIEPRLVKIRVALHPSADASAPPGLVITRDRVLIPSAVYGSPIPVDPGEHTVRAMVGDHEVWQRVIEARNPGETFTVEVPSSVWARADVPADTSGPSAVGTSHSSSPLRPVGYAIGAVGVAALATGTVFGVSAIQLAQKAKTMCPGDACPSSQGISTNQSARTDATIADVTFAVGGAAIVTGLVLLLVHPSEGAVVSHVDVVVDRTGARASLNFSF